MPKIAPAFAGLIFLFLGAAASWCVASMLRNNRKDILVSTPIAPELEFRLPSTGMARLLVESPRTSASYRNMRIELTEQQTGETVSAEYSLVTAQGAVYGLSTMQVPFGPPRMLRAGVYRARIGGLDSAIDNSRYRLIISRPYMARLVLQIIVLVLCGVAMLLDLIWAVWSAGLLKTIPPA